MLRKVRQKYHLRIPSKVLMANYDDKEGDLYIRFREAEHIEGEPTDDGLVIVHRDAENHIAAIEVLNLGELGSPIGFLPEEGAQTVTLGGMEYMLANIERTVRHKGVKMFLDLIILSSLKSRELSGYDVMTVVYDKFHVLLSPGTIYPVLNSLRRQGLVKAEITKHKKIHRLTEKGRSYTDLLLEEYDKFYSQLKY